MFHNIHPIHTIVRIKTRTLYISDKYPIKETFIERIVVNAQSMLDLILQNEEEWAKKWSQQAVGETNQDKTKPLN